MTGMHKCPHCSFVTSRKGPLQLHIIHKHAAIVQKNRCIIGMLPNPSESLRRIALALALALTLALASRLVPRPRPSLPSPSPSPERRRGRDVDIAMIISDVLANVVGGRARPKWLRIDRRGSNRGCSKRRPRSYALKLKVINEHEKYTKLMPDMGSVASIVADVFDVDKSQVNCWLRNKAMILQTIKTSGKRMNSHGLCSRSRKQAKGMFAIQEQVVYDQFCKLRKVGRQIGPRFLRQVMQREVRKVANDPACPPSKQQAAKAFMGGSRWLFRFAKRWAITLRRKTNVKKVPIEERAKKIKRWMAIFRLWLQSFSDKASYKASSSIFPSHCRWSLDQVPAGLYDPKSTYDHIGEERVHIASNGSADAHRFMTLQVLIRNRCAHLPSPLALALTLTLDRIDPSLSRHGQPRLCICFRGTGQRISSSEVDAYHPDVIVQWQRKAWYDGATCNKWVACYALKEICKTDLGPGERHLILCDNLAGQTKMSNPTFMKLLDQHCKCDVFNLLAGCTDEIQVVDAGFGALIKRHTEIVQNEWFDEPDNWTEWTGNNLSASRKRVLCTHWYGEGYARACAHYNFTGTFDRTGSNLTADGSTDDHIKLQGLETFSFTLADARRDPKTGEMPMDDDEADIDARQEADADAAANDGDSEHEVLSENSGSESEGEDSTDDDADGPAYEVGEGLTVLEDCPASLVGVVIAHRWDLTRWHTGVVNRQVSLAYEHPEDNGRWAVKYPDDRQEHFHDLFPEDYGVSKTWVVVRPIT